MKKTFENIIDKTNAFNRLLNDIMKVLPDTAMNYKLKTKISTAYSDLKSALERHEDLISDAVPAIKHKKDGYPTDFIDTWNIYKDFLIEQFGIRMKSRMQKYRLILLFDLCDKDFKKAERWLRYYMAAGSKSIFPVNEYETNKLEENGKANQATFTIPTKKKSKSAAHTRTSRRRKNTTSGN